MNKVENLLLDFFKANKNFSGKYTITISVDDRVSIKGSKNTDEDVLLTTLFASISLLINKHEYDKENKEIYQGFCEIIEHLLEEK